jgi:hypothetical protein
MLGMVVMYEQEMILGGSYFIRDAGDIEITKKLKIKSWMEERTE